MLPGWPAVLAGAVAMARSDGIKEKIPKMEGEPRVGKWVVTIDSPDMSNARIQLWFKEAEKPDDDSIVEKVILEGALPIQCP